MPLDYNLFGCDKATRKYTENFMTLPKTCEYVKNLKFVDGYINSNVAENDKLKSMSDIMTIIKSKKCFDVIKPNSNVNDTLISIYNLYQLNNFFNNIITIFCTESKGGKRKRKINKRKTKRRRSNKRKSLKRKSLKR